MVNKCYITGTYILEVDVIFVLSRALYFSRGGSPDLPQHSTCLLDDSLLDDTFVSTTTGGITTPGSADCKTEINNVNYIYLSLSLSLSLSHTHTHTHTHTYSLHSTSLNRQ